LLHASLEVHASPSVHAVPSGAGGSEQVPLAELHVPAMWHGSDAVQVTGLAPVQRPDWQMSVWVQASPSEQAVPLAVGGLLQVPLVGLQVPARWH